MSLNSIVAIVEGPGEVDAVPILLRRILWQEQHWNINISSPIINAHGIDNMTKIGGLERFLNLALRRQDCHAILILIDADVNCAKDIAMSFANRAFQNNQHIPTAVVAAKYRYENWFLASCETLAGKCGLIKNLQIIEHPEEIPDPKRWLSNYMDPGRAYRETMHQASMTDLLDLEIVSERSRSFRRMMHAVEELLTGILSGSPQITPR